MAATKSKEKSQPRQDGSLRQSQLVTGFGPGAMVDLVDRAVVVGGLEHWSYGREGFVKLDDPRLRRSLLPRLKALDPDLDLARDGYFRMAPAGDSREPHPLVGVRALEFPRWFVCQACRRLTRPADLFGDELKTKAGRYQHQCGKNQRGSAVPVRFVGACKRGHLSDFPWIPFAHIERDSGVCDLPKLFLYEGATGDFGKIRVACENCQHSQPMNRAMAAIFDCPGDRPWLGGRAANEPCDQDLQLLVRTASNAYFGQIVSALRLPEAPADPVRMKLKERDVWSAVQKVDSVEELKLLMKLQDVVAGALKGFDLERVVAAIAAERGAETEQSERPLRSAEYERLVDAPVEELGSGPDRGVEFAAYRIPKQRISLPVGVRGLVIVPELREVRVQVSFSRFDSVSANLQGEYDFDRFKVKPTVLTLPTGNQKWLPAAEIRGEGIFVELDAQAVRAWEARRVVADREDRLRKAFEADGGGDFPGVRFYLLHSLSHLLLTAISLECGYAATAIRERIYCGRAEEAGPDMAGILLSTGTTGSEGTLGGLVEEGRRVRHHLREAWDLGRLCSNDPVCAAHDPASEGSDRRTEGAACHGCLYVAECSCERFNRFLDRALVVPTIGNDPELAFFKERP